MLPVIFFTGLIAIIAWLLVRVVRTLRFSFRDKVALITGGSRGLGLVIARQISDHGGKVVLLARDAEELMRAKEDLVARGGQILTIPCDLLDPLQTESAIGQAVAHFGRVDVLINNAGIIQVGPLDHMQREDFERAMRIHFWAPFELVRQIAPEMKKNGGGRIVNISSIGGKIAVPHLAPYCVSKFALTAFSDAVRTELARDNIRVTTVAPGLMRTGSHVNAQFKGKHDAEFAWFAVSAGMPLISMNAERAARKILAACRRGQPSLTLTFAARFAILGNALMPNVTGYMMKIVNRFLPRSADIEGDVCQLGWESRRRGAVPPWLIQLSDGASVRNNEQPPK